MVVVPSMIRAVSSSCFVPGILLEVSDLGLQLSKEVANLVRGHGYHFFWRARKRMGVGRKDSWNVTARCFFP